MGSVERELKRWWREYPGTSEPLRSPASEFYIGAVGTSTNLIGGQPDWWDAMSEAIEAAEALGL